jgi:shikimate dehydrogenase
VPDKFELPINASTRFCAVYGQPVRHSASPAMQNAGLAALGLNWRYLAFEVAPDQLGTAIEGAKAMRFVGLNLTVPHKLLACGMVDALHDSARSWGAVNTIRFEGQGQDGQWRPLREFNDSPSQVRSHGFNTDADAIIRALREDLDVSVPGKRVVVLGAGGAGRTAALRLAAQGAGELFLVNRTLGKAAAIAKEISDRYPTVKVHLGYPAEDADLLLNATSVGLRTNDPLPLDTRAFPLKRVPAVFDMIYRPAKTLLLASAEAAGCRCANGLGMLLYQGTEALELWTGAEAPIKVMRQALEHNIYGNA